MSDSHTSAHLADVIRKITDKFYLSHKVLAVVTDTYNIVGAIVNELKWKHFGYFAHTLNLIVQDALKVTKQLRNKLRAIVSHFKISTTALEKLLKAEKNLGMAQKKNGFKTIQQDGTRRTIRSSGIL